MAECTYTRKPALAFAARMLAALKAGPMTRLELEPLLHSSKSNVLRYLNMLNGRLGHPKRIHICGYHHGTAGGRTAIYALGDKPDAIPSGPRTGAQRFASLTADPDRYHRHKALQVIRLKIRKTRGHQQNPFSALGL